MTMDYKNKRMFELNNAMLDIADNQKDMDRSDLQGCFEAIALQIAQRESELLEAMEKVYQLVQIARKYFPKSIKNNDKFDLENTNATIGKTVYRIQPDLFGFMLGK
jgi:hypothetical protein